MNTYRGRPVSSGVAIGPAYILKRREDETDARKSYSGATESIRVEAELARLEKALEFTRGRMDSMILDAGIKAGKDAAQIFLMHKLILDGREFKNLARLCIEDGHMTAEEAVRKSGEALAGKFDELDDEYVRDRADDVRDIMNEVIVALADNCAVKNKGDYDEYPHILVAKNLLPSDVVGLNKDYVQAIVTVDGSPTSHASILAHMMDIPMVVSVPIDVDEIEDGTPIYVNADTGDVILSPDVDFADEVRKSVDPTKYELRDWVGRETVTLGGRHVDLYANISSIVDMRYARDNDAEGIGLYRSEFMYMDRAEAPSEDEQYAVYTRLLSMADGKPVTVRTIDIGGDKMLPYLDTGSRRGLEVCLAQTDIFRIQLRALLRASLQGDLRIMYPYVRSVHELMEASSILGEVKWSLLSEVGSVQMPVGIMIETRDAVDAIDELIAYADFVSIGTNDLTADIYGTDRTGGATSGGSASDGADGAAAAGDGADGATAAGDGAVTAVDPEADGYSQLLHAIRRVVDVTHAAGKRVSICGEIASRRDYTEKLLRTGVDALSVAPADILIMRKTIAGL